MSTVFVIVCKTLSKLTWAVSVQMLQICKANVFPLSSSGAELCGYCWSGTMFYVDKPRDDVRGGKL